jgi:hypothetical protein
VAYSESHLGCKPQGRGLQDAESYIFDMGGLYYFSINLAFLSKSPYNNKCNSIEAGEVYEQAVIILSVTGKPRSAYVT